jgi:hypothetical protein
MFLITTKSDIRHSISPQKLILSLPNPPDHTLQTPFLFTTHRELVTPFSFRYGIQNE